MSIPGTVKLMLICAAANKEIARDVAATHGYVWNGLGVDYGCAADLDYLVRNDYLSFDESVDRLPVEVTADGELALKGALL